MPLIPRPRRVFYGWWIVAASFVITLYTGGTVFYAFTAFFEPIAKDFGWSYAQISFASSLRGLEEGIIIPLVGILADRLGPRKVMLAGALVTAAGFGVLGRVDSLGTFYLAYGIIGIGVSCCTMTVVLTAVANWFRGKVGMAGGIAISGFGASGLIIPPIVWLIETYDWRTAVDVMGLGMLVIVAPLSLVFRHKPEQYGYLPDGRTADDPAPGAPAAPPAPEEVSMGFRQACRGGTLWRMVVAFTYHAFVVAAVITHVMPYLSSVGISRYVSSLVATAIPAMSVLGRLGLGWVGDRHDRRRVAALAFCMVAAGLVVLGSVTSSNAWLILPAVALFGVGYGGTTSLRAALGRESFGRASFGTIFGLLMGINGTLGMAGPLVAGWAYDTWGGYQATWFVFAGLIVIPLAAILTVPSTRRSARSRP